MNYCLLSVLLVVVCVSVFENSYDQVCNGKLVEADVKIIMTQRKLK